MSQDDKVRRIYHWMTVNFKHKHADEFVKAKNYYDLTSTKAQTRAPTKTPRFFGPWPPFLFLLS